MSVHTYPFVCNYINIGRCDQDFINKLPMPMSHLRLATGYGCATIFWFLRNCPEYLNQFDCCGTIMDFVVAMITDNHDEKPVMSVHNAASWGYFDTVSNKVSTVYNWNGSTLKTLLFSIWIIALFNIFIIHTFQWNEDLLRQEGFPVEMLPPVVAAGTDVGVLSMSWFDIPKGDLRLEYFIMLYWDITTINL